MFETSQRAFCRTHIFLAYVMILISKQYDVKILHEYKDEHNEEERYNY